MIDRHAIDGKPTAAEWRQIDSVFERAIKLPRSSLHGVLNGTEQYFVLRQDRRQIIGVYILRTRPLRDCLDAEDYPAVAKYKGVGVEGVLLALDPDYHGQGLGRNLINIPQELGYAYVWGQAMGELDNLEKWKRRREHIATIGNVHITAQAFR